MTFREWIESWWPWGKEAETVEIKPLPPVVHVVPVRKELDVNDLIVELKRVMAAQLGKPYSFAKEVKLDDPSPKAFDCSEFIEWAFAQIGKVISDGSWNQYDESEPTDDPRPGDLGFFKRPGERVHHVGMLYDENNVIESRGEPYFRVIYRPRKKWEAWKDFTGWRRPIVLKGE